MIRLVCLNVERSKHLERILPFLAAQKPDVVCLQELLERDIPYFEEVIGPCRAYGIDGMHPADPPESGAVMEGAGIFSALPILERHVTYYAGSEDHARTRQAQRMPDDLAVVSCVMQKDGEDFRVLTTHFTWTPDGQPSEKQRADMKSLLAALDTLGEFVFCGDFNAPRGGEIFAMLASRYKDHIPPEYKTSIDVKLHRAGHLPAEEMDKKMVDGLFTTSEYAAKDVALHSGVSDHMAITATITKTMDFR
jgi:endonuclease/exonuclease/phosphatase family metal-dependent hydrolase